MAGTSPAMTARGSEPRRPRRHSAAHSTALCSTTAGVTALGIENFFLARIGQQAFTLQLLLQDAQGLGDVVVAYQFLHEASISRLCAARLRKAPRLGCQTRGLS